MLETDYTRIADSLHDLVGFVREAMKDCSEDQKLELRVVLDHIARAIASVDRAYDMPSARQVGAKVGV